MSQPQQRHQHDPRLAPSAGGGGLSGLLVVLAMVVATVSIVASIDGCKEDVVEQDAGEAPVRDGGSLCDSEPNEWRVQAPSAAVVIDDAGVRANLFSIWGVDVPVVAPELPKPPVVFAVGSSGMAIVDDGSGWRRLDTPTDVTLTSVWGASPTDVWAAGFGGTVIHYDGTSWTDRSPPTDLFKTVDGGTLSGDAAVLARENLWGLWASTQQAAQQTVTSAVFVAGDRGTVLHYKDNVWSRLTSGVEEKLVGVWGADENNVFIVGDFGTVLRGGANGLTKEQTGVDSALRGVWGRGANDVYAVGVDGALLHFDGSAWLEIEGAPKQVLRGVWGPKNPRSITYVVGWDGTLMKLGGGPGFASGGEFSLFNCISSNRLEGIWGTQVAVFPPDGRVGDAALIDAGIQYAPKVWISGVSGTVINGP